MFNLGYGDPILLNKVDIHSENSIKFYSEILKADP